MAVPKWLESVSQVAGAVAPITGAAAPILGALGSLFGAKQNAKNVEHANATQLQIARENNSAQERMLMMNNAFNRQQAIDMFNMENAYNSPENQKELMLRGGFNPATMYQNGAQVARSDASTPQAASSGITPTMPNIQPVPSTIGAMFGNFETLSRVAANLANAGLSKAETEKISTLLGAQFDKLVADVNNAELENAWNKFKFGLDQVNLGRKQEQEIQELISKVFKNYADGGASHALVALREMETRLSESNFKMNEEQRPVLLENLRKLGVVYDEQAETERTKQHMNTSAAHASDAQARLTNEQASQLEDMREDILRIKKNEATISSADKQFQLRTLGSRIRSFIEGNRKSLNLQQAEYDKIQKDLSYVQELIERADKENKTYYYRLASDQLNQIMNQMTQNASTAAKFLK